MSLHKPVIVNSGGVSLWTRQIGNGKPMVFGHGLLGCHEIIEKELSPLIPIYRIIVFDQRGHGNSEKITDCRLYNAELMADDIAAIMDAYEIESAVIGGESMGAAAAVIFTLKYPERVEKLLLTAPAFGVAENSETEHFIEMASLIENMGIEGFIENAYPLWLKNFGFSEKGADLLASLFRCHDPESIATAIRSVMQWKLFSDFTELKLINVPVGILSWPNDPLHPLSLAEKYSKYIPNTLMHQLSSSTLVFKAPEEIGRAYKKLLPRL